VAQRVAKVGEARTEADEGLPTAVDLIASGQVQLVVNSPRGRGARADGDYIRRAASSHRIPCLTTAAAAAAAAEGMHDHAAHTPQVLPLQEHLA
jgi:carbamoyl-phosphate synthase large subunit